MFAYVCVSCHVWVADCSEMNQLRMRRNFGALILKLKHVDIKIIIVIKMLTAEKYKFGNCDKKDILCNNGFVTVSTLRKPIYFGCFLKTRMS